MLRRLVTLGLVAVLVAAGCSQDDDTAADNSNTTVAAPTTTTAVAATTTTMSGSSGCGAGPVSPGDYEGVSEAGGVERPYWVIVPESYEPPSPVPLYVHLAAGSGEYNGYYAGWRPYLDDLPGAMVLVDTQRGGKSDELAVLIDEVSAEYCIDLKRIHVMGTSWSGGMAEQLACQESEMIASFVAAISENVPSGSCDPTRQVPLLTFTGDDDRPWIDALVDRWIGINGCDSEPTTEELGSGVVRKTYQSCDADLVFFDIVGMSHAWPLHEAKGPGASLIAEYAEVDYLDEALAFFADHPLP